VYVCTTLTFTLSDGRHHLAADGVISGRNSTSEFVFCSHCSQLSTSRPTVCRVWLHDLLPELSSAVFIRGLNHFAIRLLCNASAICQCSDLLYAIDTIVDQLIDVLNGLYAVPEMLASTTCLALTPFKATF